MKFRTTNIILLLFLAGVLFSTAVAQERIDIAPIDAGLEKSTLYRFSFTLPETLASQGAIQIQFPTGFDLSRLNIAASQTIKGGFSTLVYGQKVVVKRRGEGGVLAPGTSVDLLLATIGNPAAPTPNAIELLVFSDAKQVPEPDARDDTDNTASRPRLQGVVRLTP